MFLLLLLLVLQNDFAISIEPLDCNTLNGNFNGQMLSFARPMEAGDVVTVNGTINWNPFMTNLNLHTSSIVSLHIKNQMQKGFTVYNTFINNKWGPEEIASHPLHGGAEVVMSVRKNPSSYDIYMNGILVKTYQMRHHPNEPVSFLWTSGDWITKNITMNCIRPKPTTTTTTTTVRPDDDESENDYNDEYDSYYDSEESDRHRSSRNHRRNYRNNGGRKIYIKKKTSNHGNDFDIENQDDCQ